VSSQQLKVLKTFIVVHWKGYALRRD